MRDRLLPRRFGDLAALAGRFRPLVARTLPDPDTRRHFWQRMFRGRVAVLALAGRPASAALLAALREMAIETAAARDAPPTKPIP